MGTDLLGEITDATGLPSDLITDELLRLIDDAGKDANEVTLDDLREILANYVQDILLSAKDFPGSEDELEAEAIATVTAEARSVEPMQIVPMPSTRDSSMESSVNSSMKSEVDATEES